MNSGIYKLTFSSGRFYVGKSIDIPTRWRQHEDKFAKGKAAARMQQEFNQYGSPAKEVLVECHADHIDIVETWLIALNQRDHGNLMLNATYPEPLPDSEYRKINRGVELLLCSTADHIELISDLRVAQEEMQATVDTALARVKEYQEIGILVPQEILDRREELEQCRIENGELQDELTEAVQVSINLAAKLKAYKDLPWYKRLFI